MKIRQIGSAGALAAAAFMLVVATPDLARAQPGNWQPPAPQPEIQRTHKRDGLTLGMAVGPAIGDDEKNQTGAMVNLSIGWFTNPNVAILLDIRAFESDEYANAFCDDCTDDMQATSLGVTGVGMQWWLSDRIWTKGTIGVGYGEVGGFGELEGFGWGASMGWDFYSGQSFALDARFDLLGAAFEEGSSTRAGLGIGLAWR